VLDPSGRPDGSVRLEEIVARLCPQLGALPRLRQRLAVPFGELVRAAWVDAADFDLTNHVRRLEVAPPGGRRQLEEAVEVVMARPLDRRRPLWELYLIDGLEDGQQALLVKLHHAIADGVGVVTLANRLLDPDTSLRSLPMPGDWTPSAPPGRVGLLRSSLLQLTGSWFDLHRTAWRVATDPRRAWRRMTRTVSGVSELARAGPASATAFNTALGPARRIVLAAVDRREIRAARAATGGTDNDVVLASIANALHDWFAAHQAVAPSHVRTMVPVSTRRLRGDEPGTWTATLDIDLPVGPMAPLERLRAVTAATRLAKQSSQSLGSQFVMSAVGAWAPPLLHARFARFAYRGRWFNLIVSSVPGPRSARYLAGARVVTAYPIIPLAAEVGLTVGALSWEDRVTFGLTADPGQVGDLDDIAQAMVAFVSDLASGQSTEVSPPAAPRSR
jgi:WS/DGAT/MGAT family acyltransferase